ncbi:MAG: Ig-like domain-containing protein [Haliea sp.]|uniref:Ig-like domain-containing protein n=1 Tax=Haliea sp. TaxID=1932666 RepID=UPI0032EB533E
MNTRFATLTSRFAVAIALSMALFACGGGGGGGGGSFLPEPGDDDVTWFLTLALLDASGNTTSTVTSTSPATLQVKVNRTRASGTPIPDAVVSASSTLGVFAPDTGTALTNSEGVATLQLQADGTLGAGTITVSADAPAGTVTATITFQVVPAPLRLGYFQDGSFFANEIGIEPASELVANGSAQLLVAIVDEDGLRVDSEESIAISSECLVTGKAELDPPSPITTSTGQINVTYTSVGCSGEDSLTASLQGGSGQALGVVSIATPAARSLGFVSATPETIVLKGTGGGPGRQESSTVVFRVIDSNNNPLGGVRVNFALTTDIGGLQLSPSSGVSNADGEASVIVFSGNIPTPVRVIASIEVDGQTLSTVSDVLVVSTGLPDQNSISLSVEGGFVVEQGFTVDGVEKTLTVRMADKFNNPVPDGTAATFTTEYGTIDPSCSTGVSNGQRLTGTPQTGSCSVLWTSGQPRTPGFEAADRIVRIDDPETYGSCPSHNGRPNGVNGGFPCPDDLGPVRGGRSTVLVYAVGEEPFIDRNGNGIMDQDERALFTNLTEAFIDHNEDGRFNPVTDCEDDPDSLACISGFEETFIDFNNDRRFNFNDVNAFTNEGAAVYNGLLCPLEGDGVWCSRQLVNVRDQTVLTLSADPAWSMILVNNRTRGIATRANETDVFTVYVSDIFNNRPPAGSTISVDAIGECTVEIPTGEVTVPVSGAPGAFGFLLQTGGDGGDGSINITLNPAGDSGPFTRTFACSSSPPVDECDFSPRPPECDP